VVDVEHPAGPGSCSAAAFQIHAAPSPSVVTAAVSVSSSRPAHRPIRGANRSIGSIAAKATRAVGPGKLRLSHSAAVATSPGSRWAKMPSFMSRHPPVVLTVVASSWNSTSPLASANAAPASGVAWNPAIGPDWRSQARRMVSSLRAQPQHARSIRAAGAKACRPPTRQTSRVACRVRKPSRPSRWSTWAPPWPHPGQAK